MEFYCFLFSNFWSGTGMIQRRCNYLRVERCFTVAIADYQIDNMAQKPWRLNACEVLSVRLYCHSFAIFGELKVIAFDMVGNTSHCAVSLGEGGFMLQRGAGELRVIVLKMWDMVLGVAFLVVMRLARSMVGSLMLDLGASGYLSS